MRYQIIQIWEAAEPRGNFFQPCFKIVGQLYGYESLADARVDKNKQSKPDHCIIIQVFE
jgi:hypothetical protein